MEIKRECKFYDYGNTAPVEYGAFCSLKCCCIENANCELCNDFIDKSKNYSVENVNSISKGIFE